MRDVWSCIADVTVHLPHDAYMLIAVEKRVFLLSVDTRTADTTLNGLVCLEASI